MKTKRLALFTLLVPVGFAILGAGILIQQSGWHVAGLVVRCVGYAVILVGALFFGGLLGRTFG